MFNVGDNITIAGANRLVPSGRKWWQIWRPRLVDSGVPAVFEVTHLGKSFAAPELRKAILPD